jgi:virginiamycin B lyase
MTTDRRDRVWFTEFGKVGWIKVSPNGSTSLREYGLPYEDAGVTSLVLAPNHRAYFTEQSLGRIGSIDIRSGRFREYRLPSNDPLGLTLGPDRALWYTDRANAKVGRMTLNGHTREWSLPSDANVQRIVSGPDGAIWFTDLRGNRLWRITTRGVLTSFPVDGGPVGISVGRDSDFYLTLFSGALVRVNPAGQVTGRWALPGATFALQNAPGRGTDIWVTDKNGHVYRVTPYVHT